MLTFPKYRIGEFNKP